ncbi:hypothetical protein JCM6882_007001 [Rhodosporidiobolus microsporus]
MATAEPPPPTASSSSSLNRRPSRSSPRRRLSNPSPAADSHAPSPPTPSPRRSLPPRSAGLPPPRPLQQAGGQEVVIVPLRRRPSVDPPRLRESRQVNSRSPSSSGRSKRSMSVPRKVSSQESATGGETDQEMALGAGHLDMLSSDFGYSTASLASRAPTFVSSHSAFTDESSLQTTDVASAAASRGQLDHGESSRSSRPASSQPIPIRPAFSRRRSSTGSLYHPAESPPSTPPSIALVSSSVPSARRIGPPTLAQSAPFSNLVVVADVVERKSRSRRSASSRRPSLSFDEEPPLPPALHTTISITEGPPAKKLQRKTSLTARGKYGGGGSGQPPLSLGGLPSPRPPLSATTKADSAPAALPRPSISAARPSFSASQPFSSSASSSAAAPPLDILPVHLPPLPPPSASCRRSRSKTKTSADADASPRREGTSSSISKSSSSSSASSTFRGSLVKLKKSTASLRSAFRSSRHDAPPLSPVPPVPPTPALPVLTPRSAVAQMGSAEAFIVALERVEKADEVVVGSLQRRASARARGASVDGRGEAPVAGFSFAATVSSAVPPSPLYPSSPSSPSSHSHSHPHRRSRSRPRPRTASTIPHNHPHPSSSPSSPPSADEPLNSSPHSANGRLRRVASTGAVGVGNNGKPRRPPPPMPALVARLERQCARADAAAEAEKRGEGVETR